LEGVRVHLVDEVPGGEHPGVDLLGERREQRVLQHCPLALLQQDALALHILRDLAGERGGGCPALIGHDLHDERRIPGQVRLVPVFSRLQGVLELPVRAPHPVHGAFEDPLGDRPAAAGRGGVSVQDRGGPRGQHRPDRLQRLGRAFRGGQAIRELRRGALGDRPLRAAGPGRGLGDIEQRAQVGVRVGRERRRLRGQLRHRTGQCVAAVLKVALGSDELVMLLACLFVGGTQLRAGLAQLLLRVEYLVPDLLVLGAAGPLVNAQLLRARRAGRLVLGKQLGGLVILAAQPGDALPPSSQVLAQPGGLAAGRRDPPPPAQNR
jgi:hypothetical protein